MMKIKEGNTCREIQGAVTVNWEGRDETSPLRESGVISVPLSPEGRAGIVAASGSVKLPEDEVPRCESECA